MTIGYLHVGPPEHGVHRYGRLLARAARQHLKATVVEATAALDGTARDADRLRRACATLSEADVCHIQYEPTIWGARRAAMNVKAFQVGCEVPYVTTVHDARRGYSAWDRLRQLWEARQQAVRSRTSSTGEANRGQEGGGSVWNDFEQGPNLSDAARGAPGSAAEAWSALVRAWQFWQQERINAEATRGVVEGASAVLVCTEAEASRLASLAGTTSLVCVPHFIEPRTLPDREEARAAFGLSPETLVVSVLGFIHRQKGHDRVVRALPHLPEDTHVMFVGTPSDPDERYAAELQRQAAALGMADRVHITGYVDENTLNQYLAATDVAVCPFREAAASGSLSTWIAAERPLVVSDLKLFDAYQRHAPQAMRVVPDDRETAWAQAIRDQSHAEGARKQLRNLQARLSLSTIIQQHATYYEQVVPLACS